MTALKYPLRINANETASFEFPVVDEHGLPVTVTGWTGKSQIRSAPGIPAVLYEWGTSDGNMTVSGTSVTLFLAAATSAAWNWSTGVYTLNLTDLNGNVYRIAEGPVIVDPAITL